MNWHRNTMGRKAEGQNVVMECSHGTDNSEHFQHSFRHGATGKWSEQEAEKIKTSGIQPYISQKVNVRTEKKCTLAAVLPRTSLSHAREGRYSGPHKVISWSWTSDCDEMAAIHPKKALSPFTVALSLFLSHVGVKETRCACLSRGEKVIPWS